MLNRTIFDNQNGVSSSDAKGIFYLYQDESKLKVLPTTLD